MKPLGGLFDPRGGLNSKRFWQEMTYVEIYPEQDGNAGGDNREWNMIKALLREHGLRQRHGAILCGVSDRSFRRWVASRGARSAERIPPKQWERLERCVSNLSPSEEEGIELAVRRRAPYKPPKVRTGPVRWEVRGVPSGNVIGEYQAETGAEAVRVALMAAGIPEEEWEALSRRMFAMGVG